ncbi:MAG: hypothetical protein KJ904_11405 [Alphaproteobacteria bacterium]|nr:hypothetical protein [Alphaproteobacteria bacterium]MBU0796345.1 hypothetical protein [Alphaproteobacteria bacterium]MBU0887766.1 hypothetical protein [Alphaproteobacteria bacterium]MBU1815011.1 hypothetical protein [Alphaproteobacteria bacterium]MBU2090417.1 hypothetical protein [Alphaproteobacteria bacterium]
MARNRRIFFKRKNNLRGLASVGLGIGLSAGLAWVAYGWIVAPTGLPLCDSAVTRTHVEDVLQSASSADEAFIVTNYQENRRALVDDKVRERDCIARVVDIGGVQNVHFHIIASDTRPGYRIGLDGDDL